MRDLHSNVKVVSSIPPTLSVDDTPLVSSIIDIVGFSGLEFVISIGNIDDLDVTFSVIVEDGNDPNLADAANVDSPNLLGTESGASFTFADINQVRNIGYIGNKQYVRLTITPTGNSANTVGAFIGVAAFLGFPKISPV